MYIMNWVGLPSIYIKKTWIDHKLTETSSVVIPLVHPLLNNNVWEQKVMPEENSNKNRMVLKSSIAM